MKFTFGIISNENDPEAAWRVARVGLSICREVPEDCREIILVGGRSEWIPGCRYVPFNENERPAWITRKKNIITSMASNENIVYMHDYFELQLGWYAAWQAFGENFHAATNQIVNSDNSRFRDWTLWVVYPEVAQALHDSGLPTHEGGIPYDITDLSRFQYFSGGYWLAKKSLMQRVPLDESRCWGQGEDVEWSTRFTRGHNLTFSMNTAAKVMIIKPFKGAIIMPMPYEKGQEVRKRLLGC